MLLEISGEITPERMKGWSQSKRENLETPKYVGSKQQALKPLMDERRSHKGILKIS